MGFISDIAGKVGNMFGFGGGMNQFHADSPKSDFQAQQATLDKSAYADAIAKALNGQATGPNEQGQQSLIAALQAQMNGSGPSLAQRQLQQNTEQIQQQAAGSIASQRGLNPALAARQILDAQNQAAQNAAGQSATLRLQEQLATQDRLAQALAQARGQDIGQLGTLGGLQQGQNALSLENALQTQGMNRQTAAENARNQLGAADINAGVARQNADISSKAWGGLMNGAGGFLSGLPGMFGGAGGGAIDTSAILAEGGPIMAAGLGIARGGEIPGKAKVKGDSGKNDTVPARLSPGEIVLPRSVAQAGDAPDKAAKFVAAIKKQKMPEGGPKYGATLSKIRDLEGRLKQIESALGRK